MELHYATGWSWGRPIWSASLICFLFVFVRSAPAEFRRPVSDECDWSGSGLEAVPNRSFGVQPVYLRCREGVVEWRYPRGALRIILRMGQSGRDFRGCLKVQPRSSGATLYREQPRDLKYLCGSSEEDLDGKQVCFESVGGQVALFLEAQAATRALRKDVFRLTYDLEPVKEKGYSECRPCTNRELLYLFCASDFVARGFISSLNQNDKMHQTELTIHSTEILRDSEPKVFNQTVIGENNEKYKIGTVTRPQHCGTKIGSGEFLFIGRWRLGTPVLNCAPRWSEWKRIRQKAVESESYDCMLE